MAVYKQSVSFTETAYAFARDLLERSEYPNVSAAASGELARAKAVRDREAALLEAEIQRRLALPLDQWEPLDAPADLTSSPRAASSYTTSGGTAGSCRGKKRLSVLQAGQVQTLLDHCFPHGNSAIRAVD